MTKRIAAILLLSLVGLLRNAGPVPSAPTRWQAYGYRQGAYIRVGISTYCDDTTETAQSCPTMPLPSTWDVTNQSYIDITGDGIPECVLLVWRPWQDWPINQWSDTPSPIAANYDTHGDSAHIILVTPDPQHGYRELWAGSALAVPIVQIVIGDVDGDGINELIALEGNYKNGRAGPAQYLAVWEWNGFGFTLAWRSPDAVFTELRLADINQNGQFDILIQFEKSLDEMFEYH